MNRGNREHKANPDKSEFKRENYLFYVYSLVNLPQKVNLYVLERNGYEVMKFHSSAVHLVSHC